MVKRSPEAAMGKYLNPGNALFDSIIHSEIYVDKTGIIEPLNRWINTEDRFVCVSRARRFGKTVAARTISAYYDKTCDSRTLFAPFEIAKKPSFEKYLNKFDVIAVDTQTFMQVSQDYRQFVERLEQAVIDDLCQNWPDIPGIKDMTLPDALTQIHASTRCQFVFIIDEWDAIFRNHPEDAATQRKWIEFLRDLFKQNDAGKYIALAYLTGILPVKKYKTQSALNQFCEYTMVHPFMLEPFVGFTQEEVQVLCDIHKMNMEDVAFWYDGYKLDDIEHIYNPTSIALCMKNRKIGSYWTSTSSFEALLDYINADLDGIYSDVQCLIGGGRVQVDTSTYDNSYTLPQCKDDCFTLLIHLGYLGYDVETSEVFIPNEEVRVAFRTAIKQCSWPEAIRPYQRSRKFIDAIYAEDADTVAQLVEQTHQSMTSVLAYNSENALSCVISVLCFYVETQYMVIREFPTGKGFADIVLIPKPRVQKPAVVIELKFKKDVKAAIDQIHNNQYPGKLHDFYGEVILVGISYDKKKAHDCVIERFEREREG